MAKSKGKARCSHKVKQGKVPVPPSNPEINPEVALEHRELRESMLAVMVTTLTPEECEILLLCFGHECGDESTADDLGLTADAVKKLKENALQKLRVVAEKSALKQFAPK